MSPRTRAGRDGVDGGTTTKQHRGRDDVDLRFRLPESRLPRHPRELAYTRNAHTQSALSLSPCLVFLIAPSPHLEKRDDAAADGRRLTATISCAASRSSSRGCRRRRMPRQEPAVLCHMFRDGHLARRSPPLVDCPSRPRCSRSRRNGARLFALDNSS